MIKLLENIVADVRELPVALGQCFAATKPDAERCLVLNRIYANMDSLGQLQCRGELLQYRAAKHGQRYQACRCDGPLPPLSAVARPEMRQ